MHERMPFLHVFTAIKHVFPAKDWNSFHFMGKKLDYLHLNESGFYFATLTPSQVKITVAYQPFLKP